MQTRVKEKALSRISARLSFDKRRILDEMNVDCSVPCSFVNTIALKSHLDIC